MGYTIWVVERWAFLCACEIVVVVYVVITLCAICREN
jgi:hypothetical protein